LLEDEVGMSRVRKGTAPAGASFVCAADALAGLREGLLSGKAPVLYRVGQGELEHFEIGPGQVAGVAGAPGDGKTALAMQLVVDALRFNHDLRAVVCNVEMTPEELLSRQLARLSGTHLTTIRHRRLGAEHQLPLQRGLATLEAVAGRLAFVPSPFSLASVADAVDAFGAQLLVLDYIQRINPRGSHSDIRGRVNAAMDQVRGLAASGLAVLVVAAVARAKDRHGRPSYDGPLLNLASLRESSELEYGLDNLYILVREGKDRARARLRHLKSRHGELRDLVLDFDGPTQRFKSPNETAPRAVRRDPEQAALAEEEGTTTPGASGSSEEAA
jgi:replicative DNA helicase